MKTYIEIASREIDEQSFAVTKQYLKVNSVLKEGGNYAVERTDEDAQSVTVYFRFAQEPYFFGVTLLKADCSVRWTFVENANRCYLTATSEVFNLEQLSGFSQLKYTSGWSKGDKRKPGKLRHAFSRINYELLESTCYSTEEAMSKLLDLLEKDRDGVIALSKNADTYISICKHQYISANKGIHFDLETVRRLSDLNLPVDIDLYIVGTEIQD